MSDSDLILLVDDRAWANIGRALRECDPTRYIALLKVARDIVEIHRDPCAPTTTQREGN